MRPVSHDGKGSDSDRSNSVIQGGLIGVPESGHRSYRGLDPTFKGVFYLDGIPQEYGVTGRD